MIAFIDTNVVADILFARQGCLQQENVILAQAIKRDLSCYMSALSLPNLIYVSRRYTKDIETVKASLLALSRFFSVVDLQGNDAVSSLKMKWKDYEDSLQYNSAKNCNADYIITRNKKDFSLSDIPVMSPEEFVDIITE